MDHSSDTVSGRGEVRLRWDSVSLDEPGNSQKLRAPTGPISTRNNRGARSKLTSITGRAVSLLRKEAHSLSALPARHVVARRPPRVTSPS